MADKILMNKNTLATLKIELGEYKDALPVFEMKEQQLKSIINQIEESVEALQKDVEETNSQAKAWMAVMTDESVEIADWIRVKDVITEEKEIVGVTIDSYIDITFDQKEMDYLDTPLWVDEAIELIRDQKTKQTILDIEEKSLELLREELAEARRMKNALKEVFIPETIHTIRKIEIYLGDVERLAIGCAKLVKKKKQQKQAMA
ncbi:MAG: V-type ATP synthase subunit D [Saprospiraceae bacterium]|nr:V-type ATP synthase subunit D [Saprospiraceae bacterium]